MVRNPSSHIFETHSFAVVFCVDRQQFEQRCESTGQEIGCEFDLKTVPFSELILGSDTDPWRVQSFFMQGNGHEACKLFIADTSVDLPMVKCGIVIFVQLQRKLSRRNQIGESDPGK